MPNPCRIVPKYDGRMKVPVKGLEMIGRGGEVVEVAVQAKVFGFCHRSFTTIQDDIHLILKVE